MRRARAAIELRGHQGLVWAILWACLATLWWLGPMPWGSLPVALGSGTAVPITYRPPR